MVDEAEQSQIEHWKALTWTIELHQEEFVPMSKVENILVQNQVKKIALLKKESKSCEESLRTANIEIKRIQETAFKKKCYHAH